MDVDLRTTTPAGTLYVGVDRSPCARLALRWAAGAAGLLDLPLRVVEAWQYPSDTVAHLGTLTLHGPAETDARLARELQHLVAEVVGTDHGLDLAVEVVRGPTTPALIHLADAHAAMIVVGSRGLGGIRGTVLGSVSRQLCEHAPCPVTVVRHVAGDAPVTLDTIVVGVDGSAHAERALGVAAGLAARAGSRIVAVHAAEPGAVPDPSVHPLASTGRNLPDLLDRWCEPLRAHGLVGHDAVIAEGDPRTALMDVAEERGADLLVVGSRGLGPVSALLLGSVASSLIQHAPVPVTVVPRR